MGASQSFASKSQVSSPNISSKIVIVYIDLEVIISQFIDI